LFWLNLDLDDLAAGRLGCRFLSYNRANALSIHDRDHGTGDAPIAAWVRSLLDAAGLPYQGGRIGMLGQPRVFGYVFNPLTVYVCRDAADRVNAVIYEVHNTFGDRHSYVFPVQAKDGRLPPHGCAKRLHVSPFIAMNAHYDFTMAVPDEKLSITIRETDGDGPLLAASLTGIGRALSDRALLTALGRYPLSTLKVMAGIHWEALKLWAKGVPYHRRPMPSATPVSIPSNSSAA
jgi:DUF1365 family protein